MEGVQPMTVQGNAEVSPGSVTWLLMQPKPPYERLMPLVYEELRAIAGHHMKQERAGHTLTPTALVHETYVKLVGLHEIQWANRAHFFFAAAEAMRRILIDHARAKSRLKRGGDLGRVPLEGDATIAAWIRTDDPDELLSLDDSIRRLEVEDPELAAIVRLRFFAGLSVEQTASAMGLSPATVKRRWAFARALLASAVLLPECDAL
jgi:RNA polymerase sigma factor (TIGR02999 family)